MGLLCFAGDWSEPVMWSHYAEKHTGICLGFDVSRSAVQQVSYQDDRILAALSPTLTPDNLSEEHNSCCALSPEDGGMKKSTVDS
jgi:hypothetical protein